MDCPPGPMSALGGSGRAAPKEEVPVFTPKRHRPQALSHHAAGPCEIPRCARKCGTFILPSAKLPLSAQGRAGDATMYMRRRFRFRPLLVESWPLILIVSAWSIAVVILHEIVE